MARNLTTSISVSLSDNVLLPLYIYIDINTADVDESPELFKNQVYSLTGVPPERQKIMIKGGIMKVWNGNIRFVCKILANTKLSFCQDDTDLSKLTVKEVPQAHHNIACPKAMAALTVHNNSRDTLL